MFIKLSPLVLVALMALLPSSLVAQAEFEWAYVGTYTNGSSKGIYRLSLDPRSGQLQAHGLAASAGNPSFLALHPFHDILYAVNETSDTGATPDSMGGGGVTAFHIDRDTGQLTALNRQPTAGGAACHLTIDATGQFVLIANYGGGNIAVIGLAKDGSLLTQTDMVQHEGHSINPRRQQAPHAHSIDLDASNRLAFSADLGIDKILIYRFDVDHGKLQPAGFAKVAAGAGPRHFAIHPRQKYAYAINELDSTVTAFQMDVEHATLTELQTISALPSDFSGDSYAAEILVSADGRFVYCSNRGHDSIAVFQVAADSGALTLRQHQSTRGKTPRHFSFDPTGSFLIVANQNSDNIAAFRIDKETGLLEPSGDPIDIPSPVCVQFIAKPR